MRGGWESLFERGRFCLGVWWRYGSSSLTPCDGRSPDPAIFFWRSPFARLPFYRVSFPRPMTCAVRRVHWVRLVRNPAARIRRIFRTGARHMVYDYQPPRVRARRGHARALSIRAVLTAAGAALAPAAPYSSAG